MSTPCDRRVLLALLISAIAAQSGAAQVTAPRNTRELPRISAPVDLQAAWRMDDGGLVGIHRSDMSDTGWRFIDFRSGASHRLYPDGTDRFISSDDWTGATPARHRYEIRRPPGGAPTLHMHSVGENSRIGRRVSVVEDTVTFRSDSVALFGRLVRPVGTGPWPVVIFVHGSERVPATDHRFEPYLLAANGIAMFVYDKRGTGRSRGGDTQRFDVLAGDVVAAAQWLRTQPGLDTTRMGLAGFSQGGWVAPLAASRDPGLRFALIGYGMTMSVAEEDRIESPLKLRALGFGDSDIREFEDLNGALHRTAAQQFAPGWREIEDKLARYRDRRWLAAVSGMETWASTMLKMGLDQAKVALPSAFANYFQPFYDPLVTLDAVQIPMFWMLAGDDLEAPSARTIADLTRLRERGKPFTLRVFPNTDHGIIEYRKTDSGRLRTKYAAEYFPAMIKWLRQQVVR